MAREKFCPKCGEDITDSYYGPIDDEEAGVKDGGGWYCDDCELPVPEEDYDQDSSAD